MYTKTPRRPKAKKGTVQFKDSNGRLQLVFRYQGKQHWLSTGLPFTEDNINSQRGKAKQIESDIAWNNFDSSLARYKPQSALSTVAAAPKENLWNIWQRFLALKEQSCRPNTIANNYRTWTRYLEDAPTHDLNQSGKIRDYAVKRLSPDGAKRFITRLNACCHYALKQGWIDSNPFEGMAADIRIPKSKTGDDIWAFSSEERDRIIAAFESDQFCSKAAKVKHSYYAPLIKFLFMTGCRPAEAVGIQWRHINPTFAEITFEQSVIWTGKGRQLVKGLKTQERRRFPCNQSMQEFLKLIKPALAPGGELVFSSPDGLFIDTNNLRARAWRQVVMGLGLGDRKLYQTRHTWISLALEHGIDSKDVGRLVGNSPRVIYEHYSDRMRSLVVPEF